MYFTSPDFFGCQKLGSCHFLYPDTITLTELSVYHYTKLFDGAVGYTPLGIPCTILVVVISFANPVQPYVLNTHSVV